MPKVVALVLFVLLSVPLTVAQTFEYFGSPKTYGTGGYNSGSITLADVNRDGKLDLLVVSQCESGPNCAQSVVSVLLGNGDGTFQTAQTYSAASGYLAFTIAVADVNGDGKPDLVVGTSLGGCGADSVAVLLGNGDGTFKPAQNYASGGFGCPARPVVADINGDGKADIVVANFGSERDGPPGNVGVLLGNGDGTFQAPKTYDSGGYGPPWSVAVADVNGDGKLDVMVANYCANSTCINGSVGVLLGNGDGTFQAPRSYASGGNGAVSLVLADMNSDGKLDTVVAHVCFDVNCKSAAVGVLLGEGDGTFQAAQSYPLGYLGVFLNSIAIADVNGDGKPDLLATCVSQAACSNGRIALALGNGDGTFQRAQSYASGGFDPFSLAVADVNGDGRPDLLALNPCSSSDCSANSVGVLLGRKYPTATTVTTSRNSSALNQPVTFTATVGSIYAPVPNGETVTFHANGTPIGTGTTAGGAAMFSTSTLSAGTHGINAAYPGDSNFKPSLGSVKQIVETSQSSTSMTSTPNPSTLGQSVQLTAKVTSAAPGGAAGLVTFSNGTTVIATVSLNAGTASVRTAKLPVGTNSLTATYHGNSQSAGSASAPVSQVVH